MRKTLMRKTPRAYPYARQDGRLKGEKAGIYYTGSNMILISRDINTPRQFLNIYMHEETHWVQDMFLAAKEVDRYMDGKPKGKPSKWIVERMADEWGKEMTERIFNDKKRKRRNH
jgi:hypothetical protein